MSDFVYQLNKKKTKKKHEVFAWVFGSGGLLNKWIIHMLMAYDAMLTYDSE